MQYFICDNNDDETFVVDNQEMEDVFRNENSLLEDSADFPSGLTHLILVSSVNEEKKRCDYMPYKVFKSAFVDRMSRDLPSVALCSLSFGGDPFSMYVILSN